MACEPFAHAQALKTRHGGHSSHLDEQGLYIWSGSDLYARVMNAAKKWYAVA